MTATRGFGVAGALDPDIIRTLARAAEDAGYATFWANDTPEGDGLAALAVATSDTTTIRLGVGVLPIDRWPPERIAARIAELELPVARLAVGIGSGAVGSDAVARTANAALETARLACVEVLIGALGPRMTAAVGASASGALLNWLTPDAAARLAAVVRAAAPASRHVDVAAYIRVATDAAGIERMNAEATRYNSYPQYARHFARMGVAAIDTCVSGNADEIEVALSEYDSSLDEVVVRAVAGHVTLHDYLAVLVAAAPR